MKTKLIDLYKELGAADQDSFRANVIKRLCPDFTEAERRVNIRLEQHYEAQFERKGW